MDPVTGGANAPKQAALSHEAAAPTPRLTPPPGETAPASVERRPAPVVGERAVPAKSTGAQ